MSDELKPCPFCGEQHQIQVSNDLHFGKSDAIICGSYVLFCANNDWQLDKVRAHFNARPIEDGLRAQIEEYRSGNAVFLGAMDATEKRNIAASLKAGLLYFGCDTPDNLADEVVKLRAEVTRLEGENARLKSGLNDIVEMGEHMYGYRRGKRMCEIALTALGTA